jgi:hypothetical protein
MKAFPQSAKTMFGDENCEWGMDLRDYFAAKAMAHFNWKAGYDARYFDEWSKRCYEMADAMMKAREQ